MEIFQFLSIWADFGWIKTRFGRIALGFDGGGRFFNTERLRNGRGYLFGGTGFTSGGKRRRIEPLSILAFSRSQF